MKEGSGLNLKERIKKGELTPDAAERLILANKNPSKRMLNWIRRRSTYCGAPRD